MAGRGRGRGGSGLSLTHEQLQALGIARGETNPNATILAPPPLFPKLEQKPLPLTMDATTDYMLILKEQFIEYLHESPAFVKAKGQVDDVERYSDKYKLLALDASRNKTLDCVWENMPGELRPQASRRTAVRKRKIDDATAIAKRLQTLEKKEIEETDQPEKQDDPDRQKTDEVNEDDDLEDEQEQEDEMDDGTDYANNYFDNGDDYDEEDDNLDDGPVY